MMGFVCLSSFKHSLTHITEMALTPRPDHLVYMANIHKERRSFSGFWRKLLTGFRATWIGKMFGIEAEIGSQTQRIIDETSTTAPVLLAHITVSTILTCSWVIVLSIVNGETDIVYGRVVSGRNANIPGIYEVLDPA
jgi:hypothetical protein